MLPKHLLKYKPELFARGKRGLIFIFKKSGRNIAIKIKNPRSKAENRIQNEIRFLKILNKYKIGPKLLSSGKDYLCYEFVRGKTLKDYLKENRLTESLEKEILRQCKIMDKLRINKEEMHKPLKNIIIKNNMPILVDFERCHFTQRPKNINQFREFLRRNKCHTR